MIKLRPKDIEKLSGIIKIPIADLARMSAMHILNEGAIIDLLIRYDFRKTRKNKNYTAGQITFALMDEYKVSSGKVDMAVHAKTNKRCYCDKCGLKVRKPEYIRNKGVCDKCVAKSIEF
jgi:hypothetical protein